MKCEVCGASGASKTAEVEGSEMTVCDECSSLGKVKSKTSNKNVKPKKTNKPSATSWKSSISDEEEVLKRDYGEVVKKAREDSDLTMEELAKRVSEKESVVRRVENEELKPGEELSEKLEKELDIEFFEELDVESDDFNDSDEKSLTIGDVAKVK